MTTFNRTSMESCDWYGLLIEPVWNRNEALGMETEVVSFLLIEPVWNRNGVAGRGRGRCRGAFNRTSMESKPDRDRATDRESELLIEPVWNRNKLRRLIGLSLIHF